MRSMVAVGVVALMLAATPGFAQIPPQTPPPAQPPEAQPPPTQPPPAQPPPAQPPAQQAAPPLTFGSDAAILFNTIKADKTADFEAVMVKLKEALLKSTDPVRKQQAANWKVFKSVEPVQGNALYLFVVDPPVKEADYTVSKILAEGFPTEAMDLYKKYSEAYVGGRNLMNLQLIQDFSTAGGPSAPAAATPPAAPAAPAAPGKEPTCPSSSQPTAPPGSTAVCSDGSFSSSQVRAGTCSSNGGVKCYLCPGPLCSGF